MCFRFFLDKRLVVAYRKQWVILYVAPRNASILLAFLLSGSSRGGLGPLVTPLVNSWLRTVTGTVQIGGVR
jgi:hypothetical protein